MTDYMLGYRAFANVTGLTRRRIQTWTEDGILRPQLRGHRYLYSKRDALRAGITVALVEHGMLLSRARNVMRRILIDLPTESHLFEQQPRPVLVVAQGRGRVMPAADAIQFGKAHVGGFHLVDLEEIFANVDRRYRRELTAEQRGPEAAAFQQLVPMASNVVFFPG